MDVKNIVFYNKAHIGDLHLTRQYVHHFPKWFPKLQFSYLHAYNAEVLKDVDISFFHDKELLDSLPHESSGVYNKDTQTLYLNTWVYACGNFSFCTFQSGQAVMNTYFNWLKNECDDKESLPNFEMPILTPSINYKKAGVNTAAVREFFAQQKRPSFCLCNNYSRNNQAYSDNLNYFAERLADTFNANICLTNVIAPRLNHPNVLYIEEVMNLSGKFSLNDISYFSTFCPVIIGRGSGPFTFCEVAQNLDKAWFSLTFPHVQVDVFNGLHRYDNTGSWFHLQDEDVVVAHLMQSYK